MGGDQTDRGNQASLCHGSSGGQTHDRTAAQAAAAALAHAVKTFVGSSIRVVLKPCGGVERSMGKAKRVLDQR